MNAAQFIIDVGAYADGARAPDTRTTIGRFERGTLVVRRTRHVVLVVLGARDLDLSTSRAGFQEMNGYLRVDGLMSSSVILSSKVLREEACRDLDALALKRAMKVFSSLI